LEVAFLTELRALSWSLAPSLARTLDLQLNQQEIQRQKQRRERTLEHGWCVRKKSKIRRHPHVPPFLSFASPDLSKRPTYPSQGPASTLRFSPPLLQSPPHVRRQGA
jgi:hypothetical protein